MDVAFVAFLQALVLPIVAGLTAGIAWLFRFAFSQLALSHAAFVDYLRQRDNENRQERLAREQAMTKERDAWLRHLDQVDEVMREHTAVSKEMHRRIESVEAGLTDLLQWLKSQNGK